MPLHSRMRGFDRDLIRGKHYGQRSCEPRKQAEHMHRPRLQREDSPCQLAAVHTWHKADLRPARPKQPSECQVSESKRTLGSRLRAAIEALPFETPKLMAVGSSVMDGQSFGALLDKAIERVEHSKRPQPKLIESKAVEFPQRN